MINSFQRLRHHAVIGGDHQHHNVGHFGAARAHAGEGFVARRIQKHDLAAESRRIRIQNFHFVGADVLRDSARLAARHVGFPNSVEQRSLAMIHVAHDGHHWRARVPAAGIGLRRQAFFHLLLGLLLKADDIGIGAELPRHFAGQCRVQCLIDGGEHAPRQQPRDNFLGAHTQLLRQIFYADAFGDGDGPRDGQRLAGDRRHARRRTEALHRAFLHPARLIALSWTPRWPAWPALARWRQAGSCSRRAHAWRPDSRWRGARRMHGAALAWPQRLTRCAGGR